MAHKKNKIPVEVLKKFDKALYKPGDPVIITWLGETKQGHVKTIKKSSWGVCYMVEAESADAKQLRTYPCGIQIGEYRTQSEPGYIAHEATRKAKKISRNSGRQTDSIADDHTSSRRYDDCNHRKNANSRSNNTKSDHVKRSSTTNRRNTKTTRKDTAVNDAVKRQQDFLRGFVKK